MTHVAYFDGACEPNNPGGWGGWGFVIRDAEGSEVVAKSGVLERRADMTNNVAEYTAALECMRAWIELDTGGAIVVHGDSKLVIEQMRGAWQARGGAYLPVHRELRALVARSAVAVTWQWVPREENGRADELSKAGLRARDVSITRR